MATAPQRVLVIGAGCTGAFVSRALRRQAPALDVVVWEAAERAGGRMRTEYAQLDGLVGKADTGAQYITRADETASAHADVYASLKEAGLLQPFRGAIEGTRAADGAGENFVCPEGLGAIIEHTLAEAGVALSCGRRAVGIARDAASGRWDVTPSDGGGAESFEAVIMTAPVPEQLELLRGSGLDGWVPDERREQLAALQYSSRYALSLFFPPSVKPLFDEQLSWVGKYVSKTEDDALVYLSYDSAKRLQPDGGVPSLMAHTSVPYGLRHLKDGTAETEVSADLCRRVQQLLPWMPPPAHVALHPWRLSQVRYPLELPDGRACLALCPPGTADAASAAPPLLMAGDSFSPLGSRFDGCIQSGEHAATAILGALGAK